MKALSDRLRFSLQLEGASLVGVADLTGIPPFNRDEFPFGISIGISLAPKVVSEITEGPTTAYVEECLRIDGELDRISKKAVEFLVSRDCKAKQQATTNTAGTQYPPNFTTLLPHKTVATLSGLGWIGKCALLVTKQFGPAVRLSSVLTDAPLVPGTPIKQSNCESCTACVDVCPAGAIQGASWDAAMPRDSLITVAKCRETARDRLSARIGREIVGRTFCGMCFAACPWTKNYIRGKKPHN